MNTPTQTDNPLPVIQPLDILLYWTPSSWIDWGIAIKTASMIGHVEIGWTPETSIAARAQGVNQYPFRREGLRYVLRSTETLNFPGAQGWFNKYAKGAKYNYLGLCSFYWPGDKQLPLWEKEEQGRWFCSELGTDVLQAAGGRPFAESWPSIKAPPSLFLSAKTLKVIYNSRPGVATSTHAPAQ